MDRIYDSLSREDKLVPPTGHVAGIISRTDIEQGVYKAPANAVVIGAKDLQMRLPRDSRPFEPHRRQLHSGLPC